MNMELGSEQRIKSDWVFDLGLQKDVDGIYSNMDIWKKNTFIKKEMWHIVLFVHTLNLMK